MSTYSTNFSGTENPISESSAWVSAEVANDGAADIRKGGGSAYAYGTTDPIGTFSRDSMACLQGMSWTGDQTAEGTIVVINASSLREIEVYTNMKITAGSPGNVHGYEFDVVLDGTAYLVRVDDVALSQFSVIGAGVGLPGGVPVTGNRIKITNVNGLITSYVDSGSGYVQIHQATDHTYTDGSPGIGQIIGFPLTTSNNNDMGFSSFSASDSVVDTLFGQCVF